MLKAASKFLTFEVPKKTDMSNSIAKYHTFEIDVLQNYCKILLQFSCKINYDTSHEVALDFDLH